MSLQRVADAAHVSPYPPSIYHERSANAPPESSEQGRQVSKPRKGAKSRGRMDKNARPEEERFNIGPRTTRNASTARNSSRRPFRVGRSERPYLGDLNDGIPNYPPPTFQEAMSTSVCSSTVTLVPLAPRPTVMPDEMAALPQQRIPASQQTPVEGTHTETGSDSDDSLEIIDGDMVPPCRDDDLLSGIQLEKRVRQDWLHRRGVEFPSPSSPNLEQGSNKTITAESQIRGRSVARKPPALDLVAAIDNIAEEVQTPVSSPKRRFLSLAPLRTIFPLKTVLDRPLSAHPSPGTSPYAQASLSAKFFRSTTSLASTSFLRLPLTAVSPHSRSDSFMSRKLFSHKGKEKVRDTHLLEALDSWEELSPDEYQEHPPSLMSAVQSLSGTSHGSPEDLGTSPTRSLSFTYGSPTTETFHPLHSPISTQPVAPPVQNGGANTIHPLSLRDRKIGRTPFVQRAVRRTPAPVPPPIRVEPTQAQLGPVLTSVRTRMPQSPPFVHIQVARPSPLSMNTYPSPQEEQQATAAFQRALDTPLPATPVHQGDAADTARSFIPARSVDDLDGGALIHSISQTPEQHSVFSRAPSPLLEEPITPTRHHYPGRPLPRPPGHTRPLIDSTYGPNEDFTESNTSTSSICPEGLLIDLDDTPLTASSSGNNSPLQEDSQFKSSQSSPSSIDNFLPDFLTSTPESTIAPLPALPPSPPITAVMQPSPGYSEITDLDLLVSNLADEDRNGSNYEALLLVADFIGPANPPQRSAGSLSQTSPCLRNTSNDSANISLIGPVELVRRRKTKDGRVKLKLSLLDVSVDRCGICLSQFKSGELAGLTSVCRHAFHDSCLGKWVARNKTCPLCRVPLDADSQ